MTTPKTQPSIPSQELDLEQRVFTLGSSYSLWSLFGLLEIYVIWFMVGMLEILIALRVGLKFIDADPTSLVTHFIYSVSSLFTALFADIGINPIIGTGLLEISSIAAMLVYALLGLMFVKVIRIIFYTPAATATRLRT